MPYVIMPLHPALFSTISLLSFSFSTSSVYPLLLCPVIPFYSLSRLSRLDLSFNIPRSVVLSNMIQSCPMLSLFNPSRLIHIYHIFYVSAHLPHYHRLHLPIRHLYGFVQPNVDWHCLFLSNLSSTTSSQLDLSWRLHSSRNFLFSTFWCFFHFFPLPLTIFHPPSLSLLSLPSWLLEIFSSSFHLSFPHPPFSLSFTSSL